MSPYCQNTLQIVLELAAHEPTYEDVSLEFIEHFIWIASACCADEGEAKFYRLN